MMNKIEKLRGQLWFHTKMGNTGMVAIVKARLEKAMLNFKG
tara:strand:+ start:8759 stop:8881 length:123 start_codon:yes stop_codon:yes gene_type:complete